MIAPELTIQREGVLVSITESATETTRAGNPVTVPIERRVLFELQQVRRDESRNPDSWQVGTYTLFLLADTDCAGVDRFRDELGAVYEFDGPPEPVWDPWERCVSHIEATVRRAS